MGRPVLGPVGLLPRQDISEMPHNLILTGDTAVNEDSTLTDYIQAHMHMHSEINQKN